VTAVIWIDWYAYHVARFRALAESKHLQNRVHGLELVGGCGVHQHLRFREDDRGALPISTVLPHRSWQDAGGVEIARKLCAELSRLDPSAVLVPGYYTLPAIAAAIWAKVHRRRSVLMTETTREDHQRVWWKERVKSLILRMLFDRAIAGGDPHIRYLLELGFPLQNIACAYDVVDNERIANGTSRLRASGAACDHDLPENFFLFVGRLAEEKNVLALLLSFAEYRRSGGTWQLVFAGDGPMRESVEAEIDKLQVHHCVRVDGLKSADDLLPYFAFAKCLVLPSRREPWGLVVNEAMAAGLPVIVSRQCGCAENLVTADNGFLFPSDDQQALTDCLREFEHKSSRQRLAMGEASRTIISRFSLERWVSEVEGLVLN
jgi:1,2-diacylglycerol 3-alpha-glucosyltransferase